MKQDIEYAVPLFKAGAEWRINSVWHDAREKPDKGKLLIVEDIDGAYDLVYSTKSKPWEELSEMNANEIIDRMESVGYITPDDFIGG